MCKINKKLGSCRYIPHNLLSYTNRCEGWKKTIRKVFASGWTSSLDGVQKEE
ncbi:MAG: hypothetical protein RAP70_08440 [Candidatus Celaenobacter antarcticus]|nr:hypothetical protein [Candidatus Celaenobacter antarcticus]MDP8315085.1 hypothetical protein [Candidatus Celaenobacter antarcticus]